MSFTLLHGPAGAHKSEAILHHIAENYLHEPKLEHFKLIIPARIDIDLYYQKLLALHKGAGCFWNQTVSTFPQFLLDLLKQNLSRVHLATPSFIRHILRKLLFIKSYEGFDEVRHYPGIISTLAVTFQKFKKNGLNPQKCRLFFQKIANPQIKAMCQLFADYQSILREKHFFDEGDLYLAVLDLLDHNRLKLPENLKALYLDRLFPLTLGERQLIKQLSEQFPQLEIYLGYDFDHAADEDPFFYQAYTFLGELANAHPYFPALKEKVSPEGRLFSDPAKEIDWIVEQIISEYEAGMPLEDMMVILPPLPFYHERLSQVLTEQGIPFYPKALNLFYQSELHEVVKLPEIIEVFQTVTKEPLRLELIRQKAREVFDQRWEFEKNLLFTDEFDSLLLAQWKKDEWERTYLEDASTPCGLPLLSLSQACKRNAQIIFVAGFTENLFPHLDPHHPFYTQEMIFNAEIAEVIESVRFTRSLQSFQLQHLIKRCQKTAYLSYPKILWNGEEQFPSRLLNDDSLSFKNLPSLNPSLPALTHDHTSPVIFSKTNQISFNVTELETYAQCPFKYYAQYYLRLGRIQKEEMDIPADIRGRFVHQVLDHLLKKHLELYHDAIKGSPGSFIQCIQPLVEQKALQNDLMDIYPPAVRNPFIKKVSQVLEQHFIGEIQWIQSGKKITLPHYFEWAFGKKKIPPLEINDQKTKLLVGGRIDRIDLCTKTRFFSVVDYKTGELESFTKIKSGESLQITVYLMAVQKILLPDFKPSAGLLLSFKDLDNKKGLVIKDRGEDQLLGKHFHISSDDWDELQKTISEKMITIATRIQNGDFEPAPLNFDLCRNCDYKTVCHYKQDNEESD